MRRFLLVVIPCLLLELVYCESALAQHPVDAEYKVVFYYDTRNPEGTITTKVYDLRKEGYSQRAMSKFLNDANDRPYTVAYVKDVYLANEVGRSERDKIDAVISREEERVKKIIKWVQLDPVDVDLKVASVPSLPKSFERPTPRVNGNTPGRPTLSMDEKAPKGEKALIGKWVSQYKSETGTTTETAEFKDDRTGKLTSQYSGRFATGEVFDLDFTWKLDGEDIWLEKTGGNMSGVPTLRFKNGKVSYQRGREFKKQK